MKFLVEIPDDEIRASSWLHALHGSNVAEGARTEIAEVLGDESGFFSLEVSILPADSSWPLILDALGKVLPYMEEAEKRGLIGDEGCHWPVELVRAALAETKGGAK
jgi:hypothetical protein